MKNKKKKKGIFLLGAVLALIVWLYWGNTSIQTTDIIIESEKIPTEFDGFTIVQVSDLHNANFGSHQEKLLRAVQKASPDLIAVTGDLIDSSHTDVAKAMEFINGAAALAPVYYVTGNHEACSDQYALLKQQLTDAGVVLLDDKAISIDHGTSSIELLGLADPDFTSRGDSYEISAQMSTKLETLRNKEGGYTVLLSHRPELLKVYAENSMDLALTGHAHGGQVRIPFVGGLVAPNQGFFPEYTEGVYEKEQTKMVVSRGLGNSMIPLRVNNRPELVVVTLKNTESSSTSNP